MEKSEEPYRLYPRRLSLQEKHTATIGINNILFKRDRLFSSQKREKAD
jgi:hypothetical protein